MPLPLMGYTHVQVPIEQEALWKVHTANLLREVLNCPGSSALRIPLSIFSNLLAEVGERAAQLNDPKLNELMMRLTIYAVADPELPDYDQRLVEQTIALGRAK